MSIPQEALEILARNSHETYRDEIGLMAYAATGERIPAWDELPADERRECVERWRKILTPALPVIAARVLRDEAGRELDLDGLDDHYVHDWLTRENLVNRADWLEANR